MPRPHVGGTFRIATQWTDERITEAKRALSESRTISEAAAKLGCTPAALQTAFMARRTQIGGTAARWLNSSATLTSSRPTVTAVVTEPVTVMGRVARSVARVGANKPGRYRVAHITDIHFGSSHCDCKALLDFFDIARARGVSAILCTGDVLDGVSEKLLMEQRAVGFERQSEEAVDIFKHAAEWPIIAITGNHDGYFNDIAGVDAGHALAAKMRDAGVQWLHVGSCLGRAIVHGARVELYHPHGGGATRDAVRRVLAAKAQRYTDADRPDLLVAGHFHKTASVHAYPENVFCVGGGTFQRRESDFGVRMIHPWDIGGGIISWTVREDGSVGEFAHEFFDVRPEVRGWGQNDGNSGNSAGNS